ncbi:MAG TPA: CRISPR-associated endonuclease Cas1 [Terriglobia bacterium]|nr:CRISPR-associated endonuclease Cas1 [Terriglobia bacterium]
MTCDERRQPAAMMLPLETHHVQTVRYAAQAQLPLPARKRLWQAIARAKIRAQARLLEERTGKDWGLSMMVDRVRSGDPENLEAQAARIYWPRLLGESFRRLPRSDRGSKRAHAVILSEAKNPGISESNKYRDPSSPPAPQDDTRLPSRQAVGDGLNALLNYGYAVLRATVARAICAAGLHPTFGLHHRNRYDAFCLADDLMEPFRPLVDGVVARLLNERGESVALDRESKRALIEPLLGPDRSGRGRFSYQGECRTLFDWLARMTFSLAAVVGGEAARIEIPELVLPENAGLKPGATRGEGRAANLKAHEDAVSGTVNDDA